MRRTMLVLCAFVVLVVSACGDAADRPMAVVNGQEITIDDLVALDPAYAEIDRFEEAGLVDDLGLYVLLTAIETTARSEYGVEVTESDVDAFFAAPSAEMTERAVALREALDAGSITEGQARANAESFLIRTEVADQLAGDSETLQNLWDDTPQVFYMACVRHILTQTEDEAAAAAERLDAGEDFATVADEVSTDTTSEGGLLADPDTGECEIPLSLFVPEFGYEAATAPIGEITGPFASSYGWHIILVEQRDGPDSLAEIQANPGQYLTEDVRAEMVTPWLNHAIDDAEVDIDPAIGTWSATGSAILPAGG